MSPNMTVCRSKRNGAKLKGKSKKNERKTLTSLLGLGGVGTNFEGDWPKRLGFTFKVDKSDFFTAI